jgi:hypothetical protein
MDAGDFVVRTEHRLEPAAGGLTRIVYRTQITGALLEMLRTLARAGADIPGS